MSTSNNLPKSASQFGLLKLRRFLPFFITQLLGAFNDNVYKNALVALIAFAAVRSQGMDDALLINLCAGLFILPFFLFSAFCGQLADKVEKSWLIRQIKLAEIGVMTCGVVALWLDSLPMMIGVLFLMGTQSAFFGPVKYAILPQHLDDAELTGGNGMVELGTFMAILLGTVAGTQLIAKAPDSSVLPVSIVLISVALAGYLFSRTIPQAPAGDPTIQLSFNPLTQTVKLVRDTARHRIIFPSILAISWFWFMGATYLAQFPVYARDVLGGSVDVFTLLLATFSIGIAAGSILCERLSHGRVEIGLVPFGAIGLTLFGLDLVFATPSVPLSQLGHDALQGATQGVMLGVIGFLKVAGTWRIVLDIFFIGLFGGFYIVPLYALIQKTSAPERLSRAIACNNIMNALFMVLSAVAALILIGAGLSIVQLFLCMALANALVALYIFRQVPEFFMRFLIWLLIHTLYRVNKAGLEHIPEQGAAIITPNHVSFVDALILGGCIKRPVRFVMYYKIYRLPILNFVFRTAGAIAIAGRQEDRAMYDSAFRQMHTALQAGELLCLFPEGQITHDGQLNSFRPGLLRVLEASPVPVIPVALQGLWGSLFSRKGGRAFFKLPRRLFARIGLNVGQALAPDSLQLDDLQSRILALRGNRL